MLERNGLLLHASVHVASSPRALGPAGDASRARAKTLRPSSRPPQPPLRAKPVGKLRNPHRIKAREYGTESLQAAAKNVSDAELGRLVSMGRDEGASVRSGGLVLTAAEVALLTPFQVACLHLVDLLKERFVRESIHEPNGADGMRVAIVLLDIVAACRTETPASLLERMLVLVKDHLVRESTALGASESAVDRERALRIRLGLAHADALLVTIL